MESPDYYTDELTAKISKMEKDGFTPEKTEVIHGIVNFLDAVLNGFVLHLHKEMYASPGRRVAWRLINTTRFGGFAYSHTDPQCDERNFDFIGINLGTLCILYDNFTHLLSSDKVFVGVGEWYKEAGVLQLEEKDISFTEGGRKRWTLPRSELNGLHNAIVLHGIFGEPKAVIRLFTQPALRRQHADWARSLLLERQSVTSLGLINKQLVDLLNLLETVIDLKLERLPNPFDNALPQMGLGDYGGNLLKALACQTAALSMGDSMMGHYLNGELEQAHTAATALQTNNPLLLQYRQMILNAYDGAKAFDDMLDAWR
ncbi:hypothetical protein [Pseudomonas mohnii]